MSNEFFQSSDGVRTAQPLLHVQTVTLECSLVLEQGGTLPQVTVAYETYGTLNPRRDNAVLVCHALSGDSHVAQHDAGDTPGWWDLVVGPGKAIDTDRYFVICPNILGGCRGTTGPNSINPETGHAYGADFPVITVPDMVEVQRLLLTHLEIPHLRAVVGGSLGGYMVLTWATRHPQLLDGAVAIATSPRLTAQALAFDVVGRNAILRDPEFQGGQYYDNGPGPAVGLALARMLGHITYLSPEAMVRKFDADRRHPQHVRTQFETKFSVGSYLAYQGSKFVERFDANSYLALTMAMDLFDLGDTPERLAETLRATQCRFLVISFTSDWLFPPEQSQEIVNSLIADGKPVAYCNVRSQCGHDAFLLTDELDRYGEMIRAFLDNLGGPPAGAPVAAADNNEDPSCHGPTSIFHRRRLDYDMIVELIQPGASVLDLGCGNGGLLARLKKRGHTRLMGIEQDELAILSCIRRGLNLAHADLNQRLPAFTDGQFDYVILSQTLQTVMNVEQVITEMLRIGRWGIVSFPNFGYWKLRRQLSEQGRVPRATALPFAWYSTPNVRVLTISDFEEFCRDKNIQIHQQLALDTENDQVIHEDPNYYADMAIMVLSR
jgi:homoserine O-acetyltransferase